MKGRIVSDEHANGAIELFNFRFHWRLPPTCLGPANLGFSRDKKTTSQTLVSNEADGRGVRNDLLEQKPRGGVPVGAAISLATSDPEAECYQNPTRVARN